MDEHSHIVVVELRRLHDLGERFLLQNEQSHHKPCDCSSTREGLARINLKLDIIMATQAEAAVQIKTLTAQVAKIATESTKTLQAVKDLQAIIDAGNGGQISPELQDAITGLAAQIQTTDDLIPDAPATPPPATP